jgi:hypothetical protein
LEEQWASLADRVLTWGILNESSVLQVIRPHLLTFSNYLSKRIGTIMIEKGMDSSDYLTECQKIGGDPVAQVRLKQRVLKSAHTAQVEVFLSRIADILLNCTIE